MKTKIALLTFFSLLFILSFSCAFAQTIAVGHVSAEVVEGVGASSSVSNEVELNYTGGIRDDNQNNSFAENINLGSLQVSAGADMVCNLSVKPANLSDDKGNGFSIEPIASYNGNIEAQKINGSSTIELAGLANLNSNQAAGVYHGTYSVVFAFN